MEGSQLQVVDTKKSYPAGSFVGSDTQQYILGVAELVKKQEWVVTGSIGGINIAGGRQTAIQ